MADWGRISDEEARLLGTTRKRKYTDERLNELALSLRKWVQDLAKKRKFGLLGDWFFENDFHPNGVRRYLSHPAFGEAFALAKLYQEYIVARGALTKQLDSRFAQFFLGCNHDWHFKDTSGDKLEGLGNDFAKFLTHMESLKKPAALEDAREE